MMGEHFLDFGNGPGGVQVFWTGFGTVHNCMTFENGVSIIHFFKTFGLIVIT